MDDLNRLVDSALADFQASADAAALENAKARYLGKAGTLTERLKTLGKLPASERATAGGWKSPGRDRCTRTCCAR